MCKPTNFIKHTGTSKTDLAHHILPRQNLNKDFYTLHNVIQRQD